MTHGAGSMGGGGGYSGGGGFTTGYYHFHRRHDRDREESCACCCLCLFNLVTYGLCLRKMEWTTRLALLWLYIIAIILTAGLVMGLGTYGPKSLQAAPTDMRVVEKGFSTLMCQRTRLTSQAAFTAYLLASQPTVSPTLRQFYRTQKDMHIYENDYEYWGYYLLPRSTIRVESSAYTPITLFVIEGERNLRAWLRDPHCTGCYLRRMRVPGGFNAVNYTMTATQSVDVYFVYAATFRSMFADEVTATFYVNRTLYDVSGAQKTCRGNSEAPCVFNLDLNSRQVVVFHTTNGTMVDSADMAVSCDARASMYAVLVCLLPIGVGLALSFFLFLLCRRTPFAKAHEEI